MNMAEEVLLRLLLESMMSVEGVEVTSVEASD
jgi:hypothetical protein